MLYRPLSLHLVLGASLLLLQGAGSSQVLGPAKKSPASHASQAPAKSNDVEELSRRVAAQSAAINAGDPQQIAATSQDLNAEIYSLLAQFSLAQGKPKEATELYRQSLELHPSTAKRLEFAEALLRSGNVSEALHEADSILALEPDQSAALATRGNALRELGRSQEAEATFIHALKLQSDPSVAFALASTYLQLHQKQKATSILERLLTSSNNSAIWFVAIGDAFRDAGYMDDALKYLKEGVARDPKVLHGEFFLGLTYLQMNQWGPSSDSFLHLRKAVALSPHEYVSNFYLGALESTDGSDLASSDRHLHAAAEADPSQPEVWLYLGLNANRNKQVQEAKRYLQRSIELTGNDEARNNYQVRRAYFSLGRLLIAEGDRTAGEALLAKYKAAEQAAVAASGKSIAQTEGKAQSDPPLGALAKAAPAASETVSQKAAEAGAGDLAAQEKAEARLKLLLASSLNDLGTAHARQHDYPSALKDFQEAERWGPLDTTILRNLGAAAFRVQDSSEAVRSLSLYQKRQKEIGAPTDSHSVMMLALAQFNLGHFPDAAASFAQVESTVMQDPSSAYSYAFALAHSGHAQEANRIADTLTEQPLSSDLLPLVCHLYLDTENYNGSQSCYRKALNTNPGLVLAHYEIGESMIRLDHPADAIPELRQELSLSPGNPNVTTALAFALLQTGQKDEAAQLLDTTTTQHPEHAEAQYEYGKLLLERGEIDRSISHLESSEQADGTKDYVHYQLGTAYRKAGRTADAEKQFRTYKEIKDKNRSVNAAAAHQ